MTSDGMHTSEKEEEEEEAYVSIRQRMYALQPASFNREAPQIDEELKYIMN